MTPGEFATHVFDYCVAFSCSEQSGFRTVAHNAEVGGVVGSPHTWGVGRDVKYDGIRPGIEADDWLASRGLRRLIEPGHDHIQPQGWQNHEHPRCDIA